MGADCLFVGLCAAARLVGHDKVAVLEARRLGEQILVPRQAIDVDFHDPQIRCGGREVCVHHRGEVAAKVVRGDIDLMGVRGGRDLHRLPDPVPHRIDDRDIHRL